MASSATSGRLPPGHAELAHELLVAQQWISTLSAGRELMPLLTRRLRHAAGAGRHDPEVGRRQVAAVMELIAAAER